MKNIMVIDDSQDYFFDVHRVSDEDYRQIFPNLHQNVEFHDDLYARSDLKMLEPAFKRMWFQRIPTKKASGVDGMLFYENWDRKAFYPYKRDIESSREATSNIRGERKNIILFHRNPKIGIYASDIGSEIYDKIFPDGRDVEFIEDLESRLSDEQFSEICSEIENWRVPKTSISSIEGVLYFGYPEKKKYFVTKIDADIPRHYPLLST